MSEVVQLSMPQLKAIINMAVATAVKAATSENKKRLVKTTCTVNEARAALSVSRTKLYELINGGHLDVRKVGKRTLITIDSIDNYLNKLS